jgi:hypothetical protein
MRSTTKITKITKGSASLWTVQSLLALVFLFAGGMKLVLPAAVFVAQSKVPVPLIRVIGVFELLGALGLILPGLLKIRRGLTPIAAAGLFTIGAGATGATLAQGPAVAALGPAILGVLAALVVAGRIEWLRELGAARSESRIQSPESLRASVRVA